MSEEVTFKAPTLPPPHNSHHASENSYSSSPKKIGMVTEQMEGPVDGAIDEVETAEVEAEKEAKISIQAPALHYEPPSWACEPNPELKFQLEVLKEGKLIGAFDLSNRKNTTFVVIGRIKPGCDLVMEHPSISRYHCILQYGDDRMSKTGKGWHIFELGSTHGSRMNKKRLPPKQYIRTRVGFIFQFGESTRMYNLVGPEEDSEPEWDCSPTEMKLRKHKKEVEMKLRAAAAQEMIEDEKREKEEEDGCGWGMDYGEDEKPLTTVETDAHLMEDREAYYNQDPKKALQKFFEREGFDMNFEFSEQGQGHTHKWVCSIELPVEIDGVDRAFTASATVSTSKKDAQIQCSLEACRILDSYNVLRRTNTKLRMQRKTLEANDYYDEDDDLYLDRTGQLEKQREKRKQWAEEGFGHKKPEKDTYESLCEKLEEAKKEIIECQKQLDLLSAKKTATSQSGGDVLDDYIRQLEKSGGSGDDPKTKMEKSKWRQRLVAATHESQKLEKLVKMAKPAAVKGLEQLGTAAGDRQAFLKKLMGVRARKEVDQTPAMKPETSATPASVASTSSDDSSVVAPVKTVETVNEAPSEVIEPEEKPEEKPEKKVEKTVKVEKKSEEKVETPKEAFGSKVQKRVAQWEEELEAEKEEIAKKRKLEAEEEAKKKAQRVRRRDIEKKIAGSEDYGAGVEDREEKYSTWMPPNAEQSAAKQDALRAKFAGKY
uniref:FHA domain-containing protein n=1 Tax=Caenorhabditis tropicalis TaxID=1561998 RepID=A0A1I7UHN9_9PELO